MLRDYIKCGHTWSFSEGNVFVLPCSRSVLSCAIDHVLSQNKFLHNFCNIDALPSCRKSRPDVLYLKAALKWFRILIETPAKCCFAKVADLRLQFYIKGLHRRYFPVKHAKFFRAVSLQSCKRKQLLINLGFPILWYSDSLLNHKLLPKIQFQGAIMIRPQVVCQ